jgi:YVTN family beta-propeller protein
MWWMMAAAFAGPPEACEAVGGWLAEGMRAQGVLDTENALAAYGACLERAPDCVPCRYEVGWTYWTRGEWERVVDTWQAVLAREPSHADAAKYLPQAIARREEAAADPTAGGLHPLIGTRSSPAKGPVRVRLVARLQNYDASPEQSGDVYDPLIFSPKSVTFSPDGTIAYVNALEAFRTVAYDTTSLEKKFVVEHTFTEASRELFHGEHLLFDYAFLSTPSHGEVNIFAGKPVESMLSHQGRYLWVPYYRRDFDASGSSPSALGIIDTASEQLVRVMPAGPIPKYVARSSDDRWVAVTHWGDNTVALIDTSGDDPAAFRYTAHLTVEERLPLDALDGVNRDSECGWCLRGTVFSPDNRTLLVARMRGGGIAGFDVESGAYLGTVTGEPKGPRHLVVSPSGRWLYVSANGDGAVARISLATVVAALRGAAGGSVALDAWKVVDVGDGARTVDLSPDGKYLFVAANESSEIVVVAADTMTVVARVLADGYPVGLALSPDGRRLWVTAQGRKGRGGNAVDVYAVSYRAR